MHMCWSAGEKGTCDARRDAQYMGTRGGSQAGSRKRVLQTGLAAAAPQHILQQQHCQPLRNRPGCSKAPPAPSPEAHRKVGLV